MQTRRAGQSKATIQVVYIYGLDKRAGEQQHHKSSGTTRAAAPQKQQQHKDRSVNSKYTLQFESLQQRVKE